MSFTFNPFTASLDAVSKENINNGTAQGQMAFWDATLKKWVNTETSELFWDDTNKRLGIGTGSPESKLQVKDGAVLFDGTTGDTPTSGAGTRMMWIPAKGAFRAGYVTGDQWDDVNVRGYSVALGYNPKASGYYSAAIGRMTTASGQNSIAMGSSALANSISSTAIGLYAKSSNSYALAIGNMVGQGNVEASGAASLAIGVGYGFPYVSQAIKASGNASLIIATTSTGVLAQASGAGSVLIGSSVDGSSNASGDKSMVLSVGGNINASANYAIAVGKGFTNSVANSFQVGFSASPIFFADNTSVGIGTTTPTATLHLKAGTASIAPLKLTAGTNLTTPEAGALEFDGTNLYITQSDGTRKTIAFV